jgi:hypothetical protein
MVEAILSLGLGIVFFAQGAEDVRVVRGFGSLERWTTLQLAQGKRNCQTPIL